MPRSGVMVNARAQAVCAVALTSRPVIRREITLMPRATLLPELAFVNVFFTIWAVLPVNCRFPAIRLPTSRSGLKASMSA